MKKQIAVVLTIAVSMATFAAQKPPADPGKTPPLVYSSDSGGSKVEIATEAPNSAEAAAVQRYLVQMEAASGSKIGEGSDGVTKGMSAAVHRYTIRVEGDGETRFESTFAIPRGKTHRESGSVNPQKCTNPMGGDSGLADTTSLIATESDKVPDILVVYFARNVLTCEDGGLPRGAGLSVEFGVEIKAGATVKKSQNGLNVTVTRLS